MGVSGAAAAAYSALVGVGSGAAELPEGEAGDSGSEAKHQSEEGFRGHVKQMS